MGVPLVTLSGERFDFTYGRQRLLHAVGGQSGMDRPHRQKNMCKSPSAWQRMCWR